MTGLPLWRPNPVESFASETEKTPLTREGVWGLTLPSSNKLKHL
jgi:hypothetical protein